MEVKIKDINEKDTDRNVFFTINTPNKDPILRRFAEYMLDKEYKACTIKTYNNVLYKLYKFLRYHKTSWEGLNTHLLNKFVKQYYPDVGRSVLQAVQASVRKFYKWREVYFGDPSPKGLIIDMPRKKTTLQLVATQEEIAKIRMAIREMPDSEKKWRMNAVVEILLSTACRREELVKIKIKDINFDNHSLLIKGKGRKERMVPLTEEAMEAIRQLLDKIHRKDGFPSEYLFYSVIDKKRMSKYRVSKYFQELNRIAGTSVTPHSIRRAVATGLAKNGMNLYLIQSFLGHSDPQTTAKYIRMDMSEFNKALANSQIHPFGIYNI